VIGNATLEAVLDDWRTAPVSEKVRAALGFLEKLTLSPSELTPEDADRVRAAGVSDEAIRDVLDVCYLFSIYNRMADTLGFAVPGKHEWGFSVWFLLRVGYK
jgi:alkylhydroperoxidase family enzyme